MKRISMVAALALLTLSGIAAAQTAPVRVNATAKLTWSAPTTGTDGTPLTGDNAITGYQVFEQTSPIGDAAVILPFATVDGKTLTATWTGSPQLGATIYFRVKAINASGPSAFSPQASFVAPTAPPATPGAPATVNVSVTITRAAP
jgi:hypothetical protein